MNIIGLVSFYDEPVENIAACLTGLKRAGVDHVVAVDGAYALFPGGKASSGTRQHAAFVVGCSQLGMSCSLHVPNRVWAGNEVQKRTFLFAAAYAVAEPGDWFFVMDVDQFVTDVPDDLHYQLQQTDCDVAETQFVDMVAKRVNRRDWPAEFTVRNLFRAQELIVEGSHGTYRTTDGRYLWAHLAPEREERALDLTTVHIEHHPDRRPHYRQIGKDGYYTARNEAGIECGLCQWCGMQAVKIVATDWKPNLVLGVPVAKWKEACLEHAAQASEIGRVQLELLGIDPDTVTIENRNGQPPSA